MSSDPTTTELASIANVSGHASTRSHRRRCCPKVHCQWCPWCPAFISDTYERQYVVYIMMTSVIWRFFMVVCVFILLFGAQIQTLACPKEFDLMWDIMFLCTLLLFSVDIFFRILVVPGYLTFQYRGVMGGGSAHSHTNSEDHSSSSSSSGQIQIGSFLFWCDVLSTAAILYNISFVNRNYNKINALSITLDQFGIPTQGQVNLTLPIETDIVFYVTIAKTLRVVRFVRSSSVAKVVGCVNWYWPMHLWNHIRARRWWTICCCCCFWSKNNGTMSGSTRHHHHRGGPDDDDDRASVDGSSHAPSLRNMSPSERKKHPERQLLRNKSWGGLGLATLAAVKAHHLAQQAEEEERRGFGGGLKSGLRKLGLLRNDKTEWQRQLAATKIQRAWRKAKHGDAFAEPDDVDPPEWASGWRGSSIRKRSGSKQLKSQRSMLKNYSSLNKQAFRQQRLSIQRVDETEGGVSDSNGAAKAAFHRNESQVGSAMRELTGQRVAIAIIAALVLTVLFTYAETDATRPATMIVLHSQTKHPQFWQESLEAARESSVPDLYFYDFGDNNYTQEFLVPDGPEPEELRPREIVEISVLDSAGRQTMGKFVGRQGRVDQAWVELLSTIFILLIWLFGVTAFAGPVMVLVVLPIERMVRLLGMLMLDPLGYQGTSRYRKFVAEEELLTKNTRWTKEVLKGMETSFLMSTILRIGSLMKVGFGSAGVEIIRKNLEKKQGGNTSLLTSQGTTISGIFLFCDIRQFTDATECLQEEVFVFTNRIAGVVHSFCHSYGGSANKNIGDAFLCSWLLDDPSKSTTARPSSFGSNALCADNNQADRCLLCVVKICMALHHDNYYIETMSDLAREKLLTKLSKRPGPVVQMGFGLHAGKAVQGAIGSERKIDATYVSEAVDMSEVLESSTKKYGLKMLMSDSFHRLLHSSNRHRCRLVDQIMLAANEDSDDDPYAGDLLELYTYDIDIDALWKPPPPNKADDAPDTISESGSFGSSRRDMAKSNLSMRKAAGGKHKRRKDRRLTATRLSNKSQQERLIGDESGDHASSALVLNAASHANLTSDKETFVKPELVLPTGPALYHANIWRSEQMLKIRERYIHGVDGLFFHKFNSGLQSFYSKDWQHAKQCFETILDRFEDGPSRYFMNQIEANNGRPPKNFQPFGMA